MPKPPSKTEVVPDPQNDRRQRRRFSADEKLRILKEADACTSRGELTALLRREGLYSSHLSGWRTQLERDGVRGLEPKRVGRKPTKDAKIEQFMKNAPPVPAPPLVKVSRPSAVGERVIAGVTCAGTRMVASIPAWQDLPEAEETHEEWRDIETGRLLQHVQTTSDRSVVATTTYYPLPLEIDASMFLDPGRGAARFPCEHLLARRRSAAEHWTVSRERPRSAQVTDPDHSPSR